MGHYIDGYVTPVKKARAAEYKRMARLSAKVWREHGALLFVEAIEDDVEPGKRTSFPRSVKLKADEAVWLSFVMYKSRRHRDQVMKKVMADPRMTVFMKTKSLPFDAKRMFWGGFKAIVEL